MAKRIKDLTGLKVHRLTVLEYSGKGSGTRPRCKWKCVCECGNYKILATDTLTAGTTKSCGCLKSPKEEEYIIKLQKRLLSHCEIKECWNWKGGYGKWGYGHTTIKDKTIASHRASWIAWKGKIPKGLYVLHKCDNPACINPDHLFLGTQKDNMNDMINKKRDHKARGESSGTSKLTNKEIEEIRNCIKSSYDTSKEYGVSASNIRAIRNGITWNQ